jgi:DNA modification methylase
VGGSRKRSRSKVGDLAGSLPCDYKVLPSLWGGDPECPHDWQDERYRLRDSGGDGTEGTLSGPPSQVHSRFGAVGSAVCRKCGAWRGCLGLEPTPELYVEHLVLVFREVRRVLRDDGTLWLNLGDTYSGSWGNYAKKAMEQNSGEESVSDKKTRFIRRGAIGAGYRPPQSGPVGLEKKNLVGIPWRAAFALQADGWILRSEIVWNKTNGVPESVQDRPTRNHEYLFLLAKKPRYFYDAFAIREPCKSGPTDLRRMAEGQSRLGGKALGHENELSASSRRTRVGRERSVGEPSGRNKRAVWEIATSPFAGEHFATFPKKLVEPCVLAGTSDKGCCPECGAPWKRIVGKGEPDLEWQRKSGGDRAGSYEGKMTKAYGETGSQVPGAVKKRILEGMRRRVTLGWQPTCSCPPSDPLPCSALDPFSGSGTVGVVCETLGRRFLGIDLKPEYVAMSKDRIAEARLRGKESPAERETP